MSYIGPKLLKCTYGSLKLLNVLLEVQITPINTNLVYVAYQMVHGNFICTIHGSDDDHEHVVENGDISDFMQECHCHMHNYMLIGVI